jgi:deoxyadenosine/deoxycytidine kinase
MKLVFIYGPPAAGKLTVARELARRTGFKILHNQLTINCLVSVFPWGSAPFVRLNEQFRLAMFREACRARLPGIIHTFCYGRGCDERYIRKVIKLVEDCRGKVCFVQLTCDAGELMKRVTRVGRKRHHKITKRKQLQEMLDRYDLLSQVPDRKV